MDTLLYLTVTLVILPPSSRILTRRRIVARTKQWKPTRLRSNQVTFESWSDFETDVVSHGQPHACKSMFRIHYRDGTKSGKTEEKSARCSEYEKSDHSSQYSFIPTSSSTRAPRSSTAAPCARLLRRSCPSSWSPRRSSC